MALVPQIYSKYDELAAEKQDFEAILFQIVSLNKYALPSGQFCRFEAALIWPLAPMFTNSLPQCLAIISDCSMLQYSSLVLAIRMLLKGNLLSGTGEKPFISSFNLSSSVFGGATSKAPLILNLVSCAQRANAMQPRLWATIKTSPEDSLTYFSMVAVHSSATGWFQSCCSILRYSLFSFCRSCSTDRCSDLRGVKIFPIPLCIWGPSG